MAQPGASRTYACKMPNGSSARPLQGGTLPLEAESWGELWVPGGQRQVARAVGGRVQKHAIILTNGWMLTPGRRVEDIRTTTQHHPAEQKSDPEPSNKDPKERAPAAVPALVSGEGHPRVWGRDMVGCQEARPLVLVLLLLSTWH